MSHDFFQVKYILEMAMVEIWDILFIEQNTWFDQKFCLPESWLTKVLVYYYTIHVCILNLHFTFQILPKDNQQVWRSFFWSVIMLLLLNSNNNNLTDFNRKMKCNYLPTYQTWMSLIFMFSWKIFIKVSGKMRRGTEERLIV